jgi:hypothetical protein
VAGAENERVTVEVRLRPPCAPPPRLLVLIDASTSMDLAAAGPSPREEALEVARRVLRTCPSKSVVSVGAVASGAVLFADELLADDPAIDRALGHVSSWTGRDDPDAAAAAEAFWWSRPGRGPAMVVCIGDGGARPAGSSPACEAARATVLVGGGTGAHAVHGAIAAVEAWAREVDTRSSAPRLARLVPAPHLRDVEAFDGSAGTPLASPAPGPAFLVELTPRGEAHFVVTARVDVGGLDGATSIKLGVVEVGEQVWPLDVPVRDGPETRDPVLEARVLRSRCCALRTHAGAIGGREGARLRERVEAIAAAYPQPEREP